MSYYIYSIEKQFDCHCLNGSFKSSNNKINRIVKIINFKQYVRHVRLVYNK